MSWWSRTYNRPLKDPLLQSYTFEELIYEYYDHIERNTAREELQEAEADRIEEEKTTAAYDWAEQMEREEEEERLRKLEEAKAAGEDTSEPEEPYDPTTDPENVEWMEKVIQEEKEKHGEDFGEDLELKF